MPADAAIERYRLLLDTSPDAMVVVDQAGRIDFVNLQTEKLFGFGREELLGQSLEILLPARFREAHGAHLERFFRAPTIREMGSGLELFGCTKDGRELPIEVSLSPLETPEGTLVSASIRDVSDRRRIVKAAELNAQRLASAVDSIEHAFALFDADDALVQCNSAYRTLFADVTSGPLLGRTYAELVEKFASTLFEDEEEMRDFVRHRIAERKEPKRSYDVRTRDGRRLRVSNRRTPEGGVVKTIWDLSDDMRREEELKEARIAAEAGSATKSEFLSSMSHELRTPMNAILGFAQLLQRDKRDPISLRHRARVEQILKGGEHLLRLIDDILDLSRIETGHVAISLEPVGVADVLSEVEQTLGPIAARNGIRVEVEPIAERDRAKIVADRTRFAQILMNYGSNAVKYNRPNGHVTFRVSIGSNGRLRVSVVDSGFGVPADKQHRLFQPFQRAGQETGPIEGTGIGLSISKRLAEMMEGEVGFESDTSRGSTFWVELPLYTASTAANDEASVARSDASIGTALDRSKRHLVLYVEDNPANVAFLEDVLSVFDGIEVISVPTAELGIEVARARKPEIIIFDINLPGMSGLDAVRILRELPETRAIPVIALTAAASERDRLRGEQAGFFRYLTKPVKVSELEAALSAILRGAT